ncbi:hypothetical protein R1sor_015638 [Riccia sorocarpa]|uniref:C2H2-type domain-containing protein n=1 Tax=Riccia sorocarpa TaxID=122646 RepID=A0ABD3HIX6_9MARC
MLCNVHLYHMQGKERELISMGLIGYREGETLLALRNKLESTQYFSSSFQFWDSRLSSPVHIKLEGLIFIEDLEGKVIVFETKDLNAIVQHVAGNVLPPAAVLDTNRELVVACDHPVDYNEPEEIVVNSSVASSEPSVVGDDSLDGKALFLSKKMSAAAETAWKDQADKCEDKVAIQNINYRNKHIGCEKHLVNWRKRKNIPISDGVKPTTCAEIDHRAETDAAVMIVKKVNEEESGEKKPFLVEGDVEREPCYSWIFRVRCVFCGKKFELVPMKRNLEHNLREHLSCEHHRSNVERDMHDVSQGPVRSGGKGRPRKSDPRDMKKQRSIDSFFGGARSTASSSLPSSNECITGDEVNEGRVSEDLTLLCWGYWFTVVEYGGKTYPVKSLLHDQTKGCTWFCEPYLVGKVYNPSEDRVESISGCFRHDNCARLSMLGGGFKDLCCSKCFGLTKTMSFKLRCTQEDTSLIKRGSRDNTLRIRLDYLTIPELRAQAQSRAKARRKDKLELFSLRKRICALMTQKCSLTEMVSEAVNRKDVLSFLRNICHAHRSGAFGGKEALWDFLKDVGQNLNRKAKGRRYSKATEAIMQALFQFGGRQLVNFQEVGNILKAAKQFHGIDGDVPVLFAEDETRVKPRIRWEPRRDTLIGFCGGREDHVCKFGLEIEVGNGESGYFKIVDSFEQNIQGPSLGHASDGDSRRRKLMVEDYLTQKVTNCL